MSPEEFKETYLPLQDSLYRVAFYMLESEDDAADAVQDLYIRLWGLLDVLDSVNSPRAYCITLMKNICIDRLRSGSSRDGVVPAEDIQAPDDQWRRIESRESLRRVMDAVKALPHTQREVLMMRVFEDLSYEEMSKRTGMNNLTLRVILSQARRRLKIRL